jgi:hypothetical protein
MINKIFLLLVVLSTTNLIARDSRKLELSLGGNFLIPISDGWDNDYFIGGSAGLGFIVSPKVIISGSIEYNTYIPEHDSPENVTSLLGINANIKHVFTSQNSNIFYHIQLEVGFFVPITEDQFYSIFPELCGSIGVEFLLSRNTFLFIDIGYMLGIAENFPKLISTNVGISFRI